MKTTTTLQIFSSSVNNFCLGTQKVWNWKSITCTGLADCFQYPSVEKWHRFSYSSPVTWPGWLSALCCSGRGTGSQMPHLMTFSHRWFHNWNLIEQTGIKSIPVYCPKGKKGTCRKHLLYLRINEWVKMVKFYSLDSICDFEGGAWRTAGRRTLRCCSLGFWLGTPATEPTYWLDFSEISRCIIFISKRFPL